MIPDMPKVINIPAFSVPIADLADFPPRIMQGNPPDLLMSETKLLIRRIDMHRNQINDSVCEFRTISVKQHAVLHFLYPYLIEQALKIRQQQQLCPFRHDAGRSGRNAVAECFCHIMLFFIAQQYAAEHRVTRPDR